MRKGSPREVLATRGATTALTMSDRRFCGQTKDCSVPRVYTADFNSIASFGGNTLIIKIMGRERSGSVQAPTDRQWTILRTACAWGNIVIKQADRREGQIKIKETTGVGNP